MTDNPSVQVMRDTNVSLTVHERMGTVEAFLLEECDHGLMRASCRQCMHGPERKPKPKARKRKPKPKKPVVRDPAEKMLQEYLSGMRCFTCNGLRTGTALQCAHERAEIAERNIAEIDAWAAANPDERRSKLTQTAAAAAVSRVTLRAGLRNAPSPIEGLSMGSLVGLAGRVSAGRAMEWSRDQRSGDELPV